jgi:hypothetical protein
LSKTAPHPLRKKVASDLIARPQRLCLGSGNKIIAKGFTGIDLYAPDPDIRADLRTWEGPEHGTILEVMAIHVLEHFSLEECTALCGRVYAWLKVGGFFQVEMPCRDKCFELLNEYKAQRKFEGLKGLIGGTSGDKKELNSWIWRNIDTAEELARQGGFPLPVDRSLHCDGELHQYVWGTEEFCQMLRGFGFTTNVEEPIQHGKRTARDMRVVATK